VSAWDKAKSSLLIFSSLLASTSSSPLLSPHTFSAKEQEKAPTMADAVPPPGVGSFEERAYLKSLQLY
jgi:hypothetical protein